jgi:hypothetical protein
MNPKDKLKEGDFLTLLEKFTDEELEEEIERRKSPPWPVASHLVNISNIRDHAAQYLNCIYKTGRPPTDGEHFMFESVMTTFYGNDVWTWINKHNKG